MILVIEDGLYIENYINNEILESADEVENLIDLALSNEFNLAITSQYIIIEPTIEDF